MIKIHTKPIFKLIFALIFIAIVSMPFSYAQDLYSLQEYSQDYQRWLESDNKENEIAPLPYEIQYKENRFKAKSMLNAKLLLSLESYNLADEIDIDVKNQMTTSACWAFCVSSMLETNVSKSIGESLIFSPRHMDYSTSKTFLNDEINADANSREVGEGGNTYVGLAYYTSGRGPILEDDMPFINSESKISLSEIQGKTVQKKVEDYVLFQNVYKSRSEDTITYQASRTSSDTTYTQTEVEEIRDTIKSHIMQYGGVAAYTVGASSSSSTFYNASTSSYYCNDVSQTINHQVLLVGWDDTYSKTNFKSTNQPVNDGAYIALNSWGESYGNGGYIYISYDDAFVEGSDVGIINSSDVDYDHLYQYDVLGICENLKIAAGNGYAANVFTKESTETEYLTEISIGTWSGMNYEVYVNPDNGTISSSTMELVKTSVSEINPGYHTVKFDTPIELTGDKFAVAVKYIQEDSATYVAIEVPDSLYHGTATGTTGQSYIGTNLNALDDINNIVIDSEGTLLFENANVCIKAFTVDTLPVDVESVTLNKSEIELMETKSETLIATVLPEDATNQEVIWESSNSEIATVENGVVTAIKEGTVTITVKSKENNAIYDTCQVTVTPLVIPLEELTLNDEELFLTIGDMKTLEVNLLPINTTYTELLWESSDDTVVSVEDGVVTALKGGTATITCKSKDDPTFSDTCKITVNEYAIEVTSIGLDVETLEIYVGDTYTINATVYPYNAPNKEVIWETSDDTIVTVKNGKITALKSGEVTITAISAANSTISKSCTVTVNKRIAQVQNIDLSDTKLSLYIGDTKTLTASILPEDDEEYKVQNRNLIWESDNEEIVTVDSNGLVEAKGKGTATIKVSSEENPSIYKECKVTILKAVESIELNKNQTNISVESTETLIASVLPEDATNQNVIWESSNSEIATVEDGVVTGITAGTVTIKVISAEDETIFTTCEITITKPVESINLNESELTVDINSTKTLLATLMPEDASNKNIIWESLDENIAKVENGIVTGITVGTTTIRAISEENEAIVATCDVTVIKPVTSIELNVNNITINKGETYDLVATVLPEDATDKEIVWSSSNNIIAKVTDGTVRGTYGGTVTITATSKQNSDIYATCEVTVIESVTKIVINKSRISMYEQENENLTATVYPTTATNKNIIWESSNPDVATVDNGNINAISKGTTTITVKSVEDETIFATCEIEVLKPVESIIFKEENVTIYKNDVVPLEITVLPEDASNKNIIWESSNTNVVYIENGVIKGVSIGEAQITAKSEENETIFATSNVTVLESISEIELDKTDLELYVRDTYELKASLKPEDAPNKNVIWISSDEAVITVENGIVTAVGPGEAKVTVISEQNQQVHTSCNVKVNAHAQNITLNKTEVSLEKGQTETLVATVVPEQTSVKNIIWESSNDEIVTVENGVVTAISGGTAEIKAILEEDTRIYEVCTVTVIQDVEEIQLNKTQTSLYIGETENLIATVLPNDANNKEIIWRSLNTDIATIDNGLITGISKGKTSIMVTSKENSTIYAICSVEIKVPAESIQLEQQELTIEKGKTATIVATVLPENTSNKNLIWESQDENIVTVENGIVVGISKGTTKIFITSEDNPEITTQIDVTVVEPVQRIVLNKSELITYSGIQETLTAEVLPENAENKNVIWESSNLDVVTVENGVVTAVNPGIALIYAKSEYNQNIYATCTINVQVAVTEIVVDKQEISLNKYDIERLNVSILPEDAENKNVIWESSNPNVATVENGSIKAISGGTTTITIKSEQNENISTTIQVTVIEPIERISLNTNTISLYSGEEFNLQATVLPVTATNKKVIWESSNSEIAIVDNGTVRAISPGIAQIKVKSEENESIYSICQVIVRKVYCSDITLSEDEVTIGKGEEYTLQATVTPENAYNKNVIWESSNTNVATVENGVITALAEGRAIITAKSQENEAIYDTCIVNVYIKAEQIYFEQEEINLGIGQTKELQAHLLPENTSNKNLIWESQDESIVTVENGKVTALAEGTTTVKATWVEDENIYATIVINVLNIDMQIQNIISKQTIDDEYKVKSEVTINTQNISDNETIEIQIFKETENITGKFDIRENKVIANTAIVYFDTKEELESGIYIIKAIYNDIEFQKEFEYKPVLKIDYEKKYIYGIAQNTTLADLIDKIFEQDIEAFNADNTQIIDLENTKIATCMILKYNNVEYTLIVNGDINADGVVSITDLATTNYAILNLIVLDEIGEYAADVNFDKEITITDLAKINYMLLGIVEE